MYKSTGIQTKHAAGSTYKWYTCTIIKVDDVNFVMMITDDNHDNITKVVDQTIAALNG
jgi:hypothetical protein